MNTGNVIRQLLGEYAQQREKNFREEQRRRAEVSARHPQIGELIERRARMLRHARSAAIATGDADAQALKARMEDMNREIRRKLTEAGYPEDYLQPIYRCPTCRDTGYVGELVHERCSCLRQRMTDAMNAGERKGGLGTRRFEQFHLETIPDERIPGEKMTQRELMRRIEASARRYAEDFPHTQRNNLIFYGAAGLGKTFIADCIASRVMERAHVVRRVTAYRLMELMRKAQFEGGESPAVDQLMTCDLLFVDDLGAEPQTKSTSAYLFQLINERNNDGRHTIISTNLSPEQMRAQYTERVASRLMDTEKTAVIRFYGRDLRGIKK